jgi:hypothetical protein
MIDHPISHNGLSPWQKDGMRLHYDTHIDSQFLCYIDDIKRVKHVIVRNNPSENYTVMKASDLNDEVIFECKTYQEALTYLLMLES